MINVKEKNQILSINENGTCLEGVDAIKLKLNFQY